ncbi:NADH-quinone oxidoreductase subunit J [Gordonia sp. (in: high G+C Gram-positive bacteria)]|uniref:NADH-quinone oxidoreductase subunit J n=1 Tax=Gordonia sp. (in: high G+C Gram-positive bacteria) TaxID=84139 RepID=UPI0039E473E7
MTAALGATSVGFVAELARTSTGESVQFWVLGVIVVLGALGVVVSPKAVYSALFLAMTMLILAVFYIAQGALFLGVVQIVVYTGAVMMLFLFVIMLIGVDSSDSLKETIRGQRFVAVGLGLGFGALLIAGIGRAALDAFLGFGTETGGNQAVVELAELIFGKYLWAFELTGALLITATLGAMVLAHRPRITARPTQREMSIARFRADSPVPPTPLPPSGVFARHNSVDTPARLPDGSPAHLSVNRTLGGGSDDTPAADRPIESEDS